MKFTLKAAVATAALALTSTTAFAVEGPSTGDSSLFVTVFDTVKGASVVQDLGLNYSQFLESAVTPDAGLTLNFSVDLSVFGSVASNPSDLMYTVFAGDATGGAAGTGALVTADPTLGAIPGINGNVAGLIGASGAGGVVASWQNSCGGLDSTICTGTAFGPTYFGGDNWGAQFGNNLAVMGAANVGNALGFYQLTRSGAVANGPLNSLQYANANGVATWLLGANGSLVYSIAGGPVDPPAPVPLPAAVWLLLSGIGGLGIFGRRRAAA